MNSWRASSPLCWFNNKEFCVLHVQSNTTIFYLVVQLKYNYMFRPWMWVIFRLRFNLQISYTRCVGRLGRWGEEISTWRWPTYRAETCSCILTVLLSKIKLCSTVRVIHKILCYPSLKLTSYANIYFPSYRRPIASSLLIVLCMYMNHTNRKYALCGQKGSLMCLKECDNCIMGKMRGFNCLNDEIFALLGCYAA